MNNNCKIKSIKGTLLLIVSIALITSCAVISKKEIANNVALAWEGRFKKVLQDIQESSIKNYDWGMLEWQSYYDEQLKCLPITCENEFYESVHRALRNLGDNHSYLIRKATDCQDALPVKPAAHEVSIIVEDGIGTIVLPTFMIENVEKLDELLSESWVLAFHKALEEVIRKVSRGWIIDLTKNSGGNMYPMLAALSAFYQDPIVGGFCIPGTKEKNIVSFNGHSFFINGEALLTYHETFPIQQISLPVVVLIGPETASSGEFVALALQRQKNVILVGQKTYGLATGNEAMPLPDNLGYYMLTSVYYLDKNNQPVLQQCVEPSLELPNDQAVMLNKAKELLEKQHL